MGLKVAAPEIDWPGMQAYKQSTVDGNTKGIEFLFKKNKVDWLKGWGVDRPRRARSRSATATHKAKSIVIATGSEPSPLKGVEVDEKVIVTSTGALALDGVPKRLAVIGAGVIGLELGSVYARLGSEVTVVEFLDQITPGVDLEVVTHLPEAAGQAGPDLHARRRRAGRDQGRGRRHPRLQAPQGRQRRHASRPTSCWSRPAAGPTPPASGSRRSASR